MKYLLLLFTSTLLLLEAHAQEDSLDNERLARMVNLSEVVVRSDLNVPMFMKRVKEDTTFYKAFRSLHMVGFTSLNDIRIQDKKDRQKASLQSKTVQHRSARCRSMEVIEEKTTGDFYDGSGNYNYYTAQLYAGLFFQAHFEHGIFCHFGSISFVDLLDR